MIGQEANLPFPDDLVHFSQSAYQDLMSGKVVLACQTHVVKETCLSSHVLIILVSN
jgi:hypothetical protein